MKDHNVCPQCQCDDKVLVSIVEHKDTQECRYQCLKCTTEWEIKTQRIISGIF